MREVVVNDNGKDSPFNHSRNEEKGSPFNHRKSMESMEISLTKQDPATCCTVCRKYRWPIALVVACILIVVGVVTKLYWPKMPHLKVCGRFFLIGLFTSLWLSGPPPSNSYIYIFFK